MILLFLMLLLCPVAYGSMRVTRSPLQVAIEKMVETTKQPEAEWQIALEEQACIVDTLLAAINFSELKGERFILLHESLHGLGACAPNRARFVINRLLVGIFTKHGPLVTSLRGKHDNFKKREIQDELGFLKYIHLVIGTKDEWKHGASMVCNAGCCKPMPKMWWSSTPPRESYLELFGHHRDTCIARSFDKTPLAFAYLEAAKRLKETDKK